MIHRDCPSIVSAEDLEGFRAYLLAVAGARLPLELRGKASASDIVQETMIAALRDCDEFRGQSREDLRTWLRGILLHQLSNFRRRFRETSKRRIGRELPLVTLVPDHGPADSASSACTVAMRDERRESLHRHLESLPEYYRLSLLLRHRDELSFEAIGVRLGVSTEAARKIWGRAVVRLRETMGPDHEFQ